MQFAHGFTETEKAEDSATYRTETAGNAHNLASD